MVKNRNKKFKVPNTSKSASLLDQVQLPVCKKDKDNRILFSFADFDLSQGQSFLTWQDLKILHEKLEKLQHYSKIKIESAFDKNFKTYDGFPSHSKFKFPSFVTPDAKWTSMRIRGKIRVIGHIFDNVFYVVFLDKDHEFYPMKD